MTPSREASAMDELLDEDLWVPGNIDDDGTKLLDTMHLVREPVIVAARAELAELRARCEDLTLLTRYVWRKHDGGTDFRTMHPRPAFWSIVADGTRIEAEDGGTGLPLLTNEARRVLKGEK